MFRYLFSFRGRINRAKMWLYLLFAMIWVGLCMLTMFGIGWLGGLKEPMDAMPFERPRNLTEWAGTGVYIVCFVIYVWSFLAVSLKRLHDRAKSARWMLLFLGLPVVLLAGGICEMEMKWLTRPWHDYAEIAVVLVSDVLILWFYVEVLFLPGTHGDNRFGPDPRRIDRPEGAA